MHKRQQDLAKRPSILEKERRQNGNYDKEPCLLGNIGNPEADALSETEQIIPVAARSFDS